MVRGLVREDWLSGKIFEPLNLLVTNTELEPWSYHWPKAIEPTTVGY